MSLLEFTNNASTTIASGISNTATSVTLASGTGTLFPAITGAQYFHATFVKNGAPGTYEIVLVTARTGDTLTIVRGQEGTTALNWALGDYFNLFLTAGDCAQFVQDDDLQSQTGNYAADTGTANAYVVALTPAVSSHIVGMPIRWKAKTANTGASTFNEGGGNGSLTTPSGAALVAGDIAAGGIYVSIWDGTKFQVVTVQRTAFSQLSGQIGVGQIPGTINASTTGNAATATSATSAGVAGAVANNAGRTDNANYPVVWATGATSPLYNCSGVTINSYYGLINCSYLGSASDIRLKRNVKVIPDALDKVMQLRGVTFEWNELSNNYGQRGTGLLSPDVKKVLPEAVFEFTIEKEGAAPIQYESVAYGNTVGLLVEALKEEARHRLVLERRIAALESSLR